MDPDSIGKDSRYTDDFKVEVHFKALCERGCKPERTLRELCNKCKREMDININESWVLIDNILSNHKYPGFE